MAEGIVEIDNAVIAANFDWIELEQSNKCKVENCTKKISGKNRGNLKRHLATVHADKFKITTAKAVSTTVQVNIDLKTVIKAAIYNITCDGRPLCSVQDIGTSMLLSPILAGLECSTGVKTNLNEKTVKTYLRPYADAVRDAISKEIQGKILCLKLDIATKKFKSLLGVNIQYIQNSSITIGSQ